MRTTYMAKPGEIDRKWYVVDATDIALGRLSTVVASILRGKNKPTYTPNIDTGDNVIVINAGKVALTGKKATDKIYYHHSNHPGGLKMRQAGDLREEPTTFDRTFSSRYVAKGYSWSPTSFEATRVCWFRAHTRSSKP